MDEFERKLQDNLRNEIEIPDKLENIIREGLKKKKHYLFFPRTVAIVCSTIVTTASIVYAGTIVYDKIWKKPEKVIGISTNDIKNTVSKEQTKEIMQEDIARKKVQEILNKFGYYSEQIDKIKLEDNPADYDKYWVITTNNNIYISFEATKGKTFTISINNTLNEDINNYRTTEKQAEKTARDFCNKYGYNLNEYNYVKITSNMNTEEDSYIWNVQFYKKYGELVNPYETIQVSFIPEINKLYGFEVVEKKYENNQTEITEEEAKEIALKEEQKLNIKYERESIDIELKIVSMNGIAYLREKDYQQLHNQTEIVDYPIENRVYYRTEDRIRKAWVVKIIYNIPMENKEFYNINDKQFSYYIDATTGEIIGGNFI